MTLGFSYFPLPTQRNRERERGREKQMWVFLGGTGSFAAGQGGWLIWNIQCFQCWCWYCVQACRESCLYYVRGSWMLADAMMLHFSYLACTECVIYSCLNGKTNSVIILIQSHLWQSFYTTRLFNDCNFWNVLISWFAVLITYNYMCACGWNYTNLKVILNLYPALKYFKLHIHSKSCFICFMHWCFPLTPSGPGLSIISQHNNANKQDVAMQ